MRAPNARLSITGDFTGFLRRVFLTRSFTGSKPTESSSSASCTRSSIILTNSAVGQPSRQVDGGDHPIGPGDAFAGDVGRGAVVGRRAHERQAESDVHAIVECQ